MRVFHDTEANGMPKENNEPTFEGCEPSILFREFAAECMELAQTTPTPEKRTLYMKMAASGIRWHSAGKRKAKRELAHYG